MATNGRRRLSPWAVALSIAFVYPAVVVHAQPPGQAAPSKRQFDTISAFGDSYADTGTAPGGGFRLLGWPRCPVGPTSGYPTCHFTDGTNFVDSLQSIYGLPAPTNFAIGGARSDNSNLFLPGAGFVRQLATVAQSGTRFGSRDLVALSIGGNDASLVASTDTIARTTALATVAAANAMAGVQQLVAAGAHNVAWLSAGNSSYFPVPTPSIDGGYLTTEQRTAWAHTYFEQIEQRLVPVARSGVRVFLFDFETLQARLSANPGQYGFLSATGCQTSLGAPGCFYWNGVHPNSEAMALIARYMANQMDAPLTVLPQRHVAAAAATGFVTSVLDHLDAYRTGGYATSASSAGRWLLYGDVSYGSGSDDASAPAAIAHRHTVGGRVGVDYVLSSRARLGGVVGYSAPIVTFDVQDAHDHVVARELAAYLSFTGRHWFGDGIVACGHQSLSLDRQGVIDVVHASTSARTCSVAGFGGYLAGMGPFLVGPIAGVGHTGGAIRAYTETGDSLVAMSVDRQSLGTVTGNAGLQIRARLPAGKDRLSPFVNVTAEHAFEGSGGSVTTTQVSTPLLPVTTPVPALGGTHGRVAAGVAARVTSRLTAMLHAASTFGPHKGSDAAVIGGLGLSF